MRTLIVQLDPPDEGRVLAPRGVRDRVRRQADSADRAGDRRWPASERPHLEDEIARLERMVPALLRPGGTRRGQVILSADEAWDLMATTGPRLDARASTCASRSCRADGARRRCASSSTARPRPRSARTSSRTCAGRRVFDDVELTAADIARLAKEARPLIRSGGRWVAIDKADLQGRRRSARRREPHEAALRRGDACGSRSGSRSRRSPAAISIEGGGWAADLLAAAAKVATEPAGTPRGFVGELRSYQAEALAWLGFLDDAGLGGCLALDMGLGKTPTMLAHLLAGADDGPALVIAPPAVVGNWAAEAARFTPELRVVVHHGANRAAAGRDRGRGRRRRRRRHDVRHRGARRRRDRRGLVGDA